MAREKDSTRHRLWISRTALLLGFAASVLAGARPLCPACEVEDVGLSTRDGSLLHARLFVPGHEDGTSLPAVVVSHGYLGNAGFLEIPWAEDLTRLRMAALFLDRPGHGRSGGDWWPRPNGEAPKLADLHPEVHSAIAYLRSRTQLIDPQRIALLGHSDGGTASVIAASADWDVAAAVSLSASAAPWEYVNHVAPRNLLLLYGADDRFILAETDALLIKSATRGYLNGEGQVGNIRNGSARRLVRVAGRGHVDLVYSDEARRLALHWLAETFGLDGEIELAQTRTRWVVAATTVLFLVVLFWNGVPLVPVRQKGRSLPPDATESGHPQMATDGHRFPTDNTSSTITREPHTQASELARRRTKANRKRRSSSSSSICGHLWPSVDGSRPIQLALVAGVWLGGLVLAAWMAPRLRDSIPVREGSTVVAVLVAQLLVMGALATAARIAGRWNHRGEREADRIDAGRRNPRPRSDSKGWARFSRVVRVVFEEIGALRDRLLPPIETFPLEGGRLLTSSPSTGEDRGGGDPMEVSTASGSRFADDGDRQRSHLLADVACGAFSGLIVQLGVETAFRTMYTASMDAERLALSALFAGVAAPAFAAIGAATERLGAGPAAEVLLAVLTAVSAPRLFVRMSVLPVYVLALVLLFTAAYRAGGRSTAGAAAFGAVMYARAAAVVCAFY